VPALSPVRVAVEPSRLLLVFCWASSRSLGRLFHVRQRPTCSLLKSARSACIIEQVSSGLSVGPVSNHAPLRPALDTPNSWTVRVSTRFDRFSKSTPKFLAVQLVLEALTFEGSWRSSVARREPPGLGVPWSAPHEAPRAARRGDTDTTSAPTTRPMTPPRMPTMVRPFLSSDHPREAVSHPGSLTPCTASSAPILRPRNPSVRRGHHARTRQRSSRCSRSWRSNRRSHHALLAGDRELAKQVVDQTWSSTTWSTRW